MAQYQAHAVSVNGHTVSVATNVEIRRISDANVEAKTFTANGVYNASDDALDGYNPVTVDIPNGSYGTPTWQHAISQGSRLLIHPNFPNFDDGYMASAPNISDTLTLETETVTPSDSQQVVTPTDLNHYLQRVTVNPITYSASDEGKVVDNGALVAQTSRTVTENGTYDTTTNDEVVVNVSGSGGLTLESALDGVIDGTITSYINDNITTLVDGMFRASMFQKITTFKAHNVTELSNFCLSGIGAEKIAFPNFNSAMQGVNPQAFNANTKTKVLDFGKNYKQIRAATTQNASALDTFVFRSETVVSCGSVNIVAGTKFKSGGTGGTIYIPKSLYDHLGDGTSNDYQSATNWSTIYGYGTITWAQIEGSQYENYYADGTPISA